MDDVEVRTTSFRLSEAYFGHVFVYRPGERFKAAWQRLSGIKRPSSQYYYGLPDASLRAALTVISGDFVTLETRLWGQAEWAIVSRKRIEPPGLRMALGAWEFSVWPEGANGDLGAAADDLTVERVSIADSIGRRAGRCPSPQAKWFWNAATWDVAHRLASETLHLDHAVAVNLRLDSEASLLTWENLQRSGRNRDCAAMHVIAPRLITVPGFEEPVLHLQSSFVRLATAWNWVNNAWICHAKRLPILYAATRRARDAAGEWQTVWGDLTPEVLRKCNLAIPSSPSGIDLSAFGSIRGRWPKQRYPIGTGTGQKFHDAVALHARKCLPESRPLTLVKARRTLPRADARQTIGAALDVAIQTIGAERLFITCLYGHDSTRQRVAKALQRLLGLPNGAHAFGPNNVATTFGSITVTFISPPGASARLSGNANREDLEAWVTAAVEPTYPTPRRHAIGAAIIETGDPEELRWSESDPKHLIRRTLASKGIVTQFLAVQTDEQDIRDGDTDPETDYRAESAVWDLLRSAGVFPRPFPSASGIPPGTWLVGVHAVQRRNDKRAGYKRKYGEGFVVSVVATVAGAHMAIGYDPTSGWKPLHQFNASFLAAPQDHDEARCKTLIEAAVSQLLVREPHSKLVVFLGARGCRRFWTGLQDTKGDELPRFIAEDRVAIIRVRSDSEEVPRMAGVGSWPEDKDSGPSKPHTTNALYRLKDPQWSGAMFYISTSSTMNRPGPHRDCTRFSCSPVALRRNWHAHTMTEFWSPYPGPFREDALYELSSLLCRQAPTWDGTLDRPSPIHLAEAVVLDHPDKYEVRNGEGEEAE